ncbi:hypothetical protein [Rossellomorea sp. DA94]|uniref:hypothetical protein n=1 Tax=Rossellomorea sp. DA94 TaxID=3038653 RepID=UPI0024468D80|nr:hypothetical protein [Rossellomorea sp. DA94]WGG47692.1 hypothetical protein P8596_10980 [Rossellomorea sp. DA94]
MTQNPVNIDLVLENMSNQIANLSKEKAVVQAYSIQQKQEIDQLKAEIQQLKQVVEESDESLDEIVS